MEYYVILGNKYAKYCKTELLRTDPTGSFPSAIEKIRVKKRSNNNIFFSKIFHPCLEFRKNI